MPKIAFSIPHTLDRAEADARLKSYLEHLKTKLDGQFTDLEENWAGDRGTFSFKSFGLKFQGEIGVADTQVDVALDIPFAAVVFKGKIESEMKEKLAKALARPRE